MKVSGCRSKGAVGIDGGCRAGRPDLGKCHIVRRALNLETRLIGGVIGPGKIDLGGAGSRCGQT